MGAVKRISPNTNALECSQCKFYEYINYKHFYFCLSRTKKFNVPIEKVYNKTQREKFLWAIEMATADFEW